MINNDTNITMQKQVHIVPNISTDRNPKSPTLNNAAPREHEDPQE